MLRQSRRKITALHVAGSSSLRDAKTAANWQAPDSIFKYSNAIRICEVIPEKWGLTFIVTAFMFLLP